MFNRDEVIAELKTQLIRKDERIKQLEEREEKLLDRLMARDYADYNAAQVNQEDDLSNLEDKDEDFEELDPNNPPDGHDRQIPE